MGKSTTAKSEIQALEYKGKTYYFMSSKHRATFEKDPEKFIGKEMHVGQDKISH